MIQFRICSFVILFAAALGVCCSTVVVSPDKTDTDKLHSENRILKKKIQLVERKNSIVESENAQYHQEIQGLKKSLEDKKHDFDRLEKESQDAIISLTEKNDNQEKDYKGKMLSLQAQSDQKIKDLNVQMETAKSEAARKEKDLADRLAQTKAAIDENSRTIKTLKDSLHDIGEKLSQAQKDMKAKDESLAAFAAMSEKNLSSMNELKGALEKREGEVKETRGRLKNLEEAVEGLKKSLDEKEKQIQDLQKKGS